MNGMVDGTPPETLEAIKYDRPIFQAGWTNLRAAILRPAGGAA